MKIDGLTISRTTDLRYVLYYDYASLRAPSLMTTGMTTGS